MNWDTYFMGLARYIAGKSKDDSTKVGCVIVGPDNEVRSTGYNGMPRGIDEVGYNNLHKVKERYSRPEKYYWFEHAERNAIYNAARIGTPLKGCRLYTLFFPCTDCVRGIIQSGIIEVVHEPYRYTKQCYWDENFKRSIIMLDEANIKNRVI